MKKSSSLRGNQRRVIQALINHDHKWFRGCGWYFLNNYETERTLESLVNAGWVYTYTDDEGRKVYKLKAEAIMRN